MLEGIVIGLVAFLVGVALCLLALFCFWLLKMMRSLEQSAKEVTESTKEILAEAKATVGHVVDVTERNFGESSPLSRVAKAVGSLSDKLPETLSGLKQFNEVFGKVYRTAFVQEKEKEPIAADENIGEFIPYSEEAAAQYEVTRKAQSERLVLSQDELAMMRTDKVVETPVSQSPTVES